MPRFSRPPGPAQPRLTLLNFLFPYLSQSPILSPRFASPHRDPISSHLNLDPCRKRHPPSLRIDPHRIPQPTNLKQAPGRQLLSRPHHALRLELAQCRPDARVGRRQARKRKDHDPKAHLPRLLGRNHRRRAILHHVEQQWPGGQLLGALGRHLLAREALEQADIGADGPRGLQALHALVVAEGLQGVGAGDQDDVRVQAVLGGLGGADALVELVARDDLLAGQVAAALVLDLVFDVKAGDAGADVLGDGVGDHDGAWWRS